MEVDLTIRVNGDEEIEMGQMAEAFANKVWLGIGSNATLMFKDTSAARLFLALSLAELRRIERGDMPYNPIPETHDHVATKRIVVMNGAECEVTA